MNEELKEKLHLLADKYEVKSFCDEDPSQFLNWYNKSKPESKNICCKDFTIADTECASFIAAMLSFGSRKQFIPKIRQILQTADSSSISISLWLKSHAFQNDFPSGPKKFYRFYSYDDMQIFFGELAAILQSAASLGEYFQVRFTGQENVKNIPCNSLSSARDFVTTKQVDATKESPAARITALFASAFPNSAIVPKGKTSANKRIHMFLRWMVRQNSCVDLGLWTWYKPSDLIIPLDVHVMQESIKLGLLPPKANASRRTAELLTQELNQAFPNDPCRADYALFGLGVD
ncbi:MAG: TIGR02757 family protein [Treponema sp.]|nr:TIGR02757 family protein [Treponema sp.]